MSWTTCSSSALASGGAELVNSLNSGPQAATARHRTMTVPVTCCRAIWLLQLEAGRSRQARPTTGQRFGAAGHRIAAPLGAEENAVEVVRWPEPVGRRGHLLRVADRLDDI